MYVPITDRLMNNVEQRIGLLRRAERQSLPSSEELKQTIESDPDFIKKVETKLWEKEPDLQERLSKYGRNSTVDINLQVLCPTSGKSWTERFSPSVSIPCITKYEPYNRPKANVSYSFDPRFGEYATLRLQEYECDERWGKVWQQIEKFLRGCKSLNEALKLYPDIRRYIHEDDLKRVEEKLKKPAKEESEAHKALAEIDLDMVNTSTVLARMAGAKI